MAVTDDVGVDHRVEFREILKTADTHARFVYSLASRVIRSPMPWRGAGLVLLFYLIFVVLVQPLTKGTLFWTFMRTQYGFFFAQALIFTAMMFILRFSTRRRLRSGGQEFTQVFLSNGLCPVCLYPVGGMPSSDDGLVRCLECGSAWAGTRVGEKSTQSDGNPHQREWSDYFGLKGSLWSQRSIRDASGTAHVLLDGQYPTAIKLASSAELESRLIDARAMLRESVRFRRTIGAIMAGVGLLLSFTWFGVVLMRHWPPVTASQTISFVTSLFILFFSIGLMPLIANLRGHSANKRLAIEVMLRRKLCPACGADLEGVLLQDDGTCVCPRCLAVWEMKFGPEQNEPRP
jgi:hypothetical protein